MQYMNLHTENGTSQYMKSTDCICHPASKKRSRHNSHQSATVNQTYQARQEEE